MKKNTIIYLIYTIISFSFLLSFKPTEAATITLENSNVRYSFEVDSTNFSLSSITNLQTRYVFNVLNENKAWEIELKKSPVGGSTIINPASGNLYSFSYSKNSTSLTAQWLDYTIGTDKFNITATINLVNDSAEWNLNISSDAPNYAIYKVTFPIIAFNPIANGTLTIPQVAGAITHQPMSISKVYLRSPGLYLSTASMQFFSYYDNASKDLMYLATKDTNGYIKDYSVESVNNYLRFGFIAYPENNTDIDNEYSSSYPVEIKPMRGDWYDASQYYKNWALKQSWVSRGKLKYKAPDSVKNAAFWIISPPCYNADCDAGPINDANTLGIAEGGRRWKEFIGLGQNDTYVGMTHIYDQQSGETYPYVTPINPNVSKMMGIARSYGGYLGPYWRPGVFTKDSPQYNANNISQYEEKDSRGNIPVGSDGVSTNLFFQFIRDLHINALSDRSAADGPFGGIYWDVITGEAHNDYNDNLPTKGGGTFAKNGIYDFTKQTRDKFPDFFISSEYASESYINNVDFTQWNFLYDATTPNLDSNIWFLLPMYQTVYHQYQLQTPSAAMAPIPSIELENLGFYAWAELSNSGSLPGLVSWGDLPFVGDDSSNIPEAKEWFDYVKRLIKEFVDFKEYFKWGELLRPLNLQVGTMSKSTIYSDITYFPKYYTGDSDNSAKVFNSVWRAEDDTLLLSFINWSSNTENYSFRFNLSDYGLQKGTTYYLYDVDGVNSAYKLSVSDDFSFSDSLSGRSLKTIKISTTPPAPPSVPSNLSATAISSNQINLQWTDNASNETGFMIQISTNGTTFDDSKSISTNIISESINNLNPNTKYYFRVHSYNAYSSSNYSNVANATTLSTTTPSQPIPPSPTSTTTNTGSKPDTGTKQPPKITPPTTATTTNTEVSSTTPKEAESNYSTKTVENFWELLKDILRRIIFFFGNIF